MGSAHPARLRLSVRDGVLRPHWLGARDLPWIAELIELYLAFVGESRGALDEHLAERVEHLRSGSGRPLALHVLDRCFRTRVDAPIPPREARAAVFQAAAGRPPRSQAIASVARDLGVPLEAIERSLLADIPRERRLQPPDAPVRALDVALRCNLAIARAALQCTSSVSVTLEGNARAIVRHAWLRGLICNCVAGDSREGATLEISGPLALFRRTALYGRHLAELVPLLAWCRAFRLDAVCRLRDEPARFCLRPSDPIPPAAPPRPYDSALERRFARDFTRATRLWTLVREPEPVAAAGTLVFPDFAIVHRDDPGRRWLLEIVGFWTAEYLRRKLEHLRSARVTRLILCIDGERDCGAERLPSDARVLRFAKRVDPGRALELIEGDRECS